MLRGNKSEKGRGKMSSDEQMWVLKEKKTTAQPSVDFGYSSKLC